MSPKCSTTAHYFPIGAEVTDVSGELDYIAFVNNDRCNVTFRVSSVSS